jgi:hypothetical protein
MEDSKMFAKFEFQSRIVTLFLILMAFASIVGCNRDNVEQPVDAIADDIPMDVTSSAIELENQFDGAPVENLQGHAQLLSSRFHEWLIKLKKPPATKQRYSCRGYAKAKGIPAPCGKGIQDFFFPDYVFHFETFMSFDPNRLRVYSEDPTFVTYIAKNVPQGLPVAVDLQGGSPQIRVCTGNRVWKKFGLGSIKSNLYVWLE